MSEGSAEPAPPPSPVTNARPQPRSPGDGAQQSLLEPVATGRKHNACRAPGLLPLRARTTTPSGPRASRLRSGCLEGAMAAAAAAAAEAEATHLQVCGCKGIRTCLICERQRHGSPPWQLFPQVRDRKRVKPRKSVPLNGKLRPKLACETGGDQSLAVGELHGALIALLIAVIKRRTVPKVPSENEWLSEECCCRSGFLRLKCKEPSSPHSKFEVLEVRKRL